MREERDERRSKFSTQISLGSIIAAAAFILSGVGVYSNLYADVKNLKENETRKEVEAKESRKELKEEIRDVKTDVRDVNMKLDRILFELNKIPKPAARNDR